MHVHQPQSQACQPGELPALRKVKIPHNGKTSMNRSPLAKQEISSQFSSCFEGIGRFPGDLCKFHLKPDHQPARHASKKQGIPKEVNEHADWVHSNIFAEKALEREPYYTQQQYLQDISHAEFPPGMENTPSFPGKQFLQGKEGFTLPDMDIDRVTYSVHHHFRITYFISYMVIACSRACIAKHVALLLVCHGPIRNPRSIGQPFLYSDFF